jgi:hypothetical protein
MQFGLPLRRSNRVALLCALLLLPVCVVPGRATTVVPPDFTELVNESDFVVRAVVESVRAEYRNTPQGRVIVTFVQLQVRETLAGQPPSRVELQMIGGQIGDDRLELVGAPRFNVGDEDFLFVRDNGTNLNPLYALMHGRYPILRDTKTGAAYVARSNAVPLQDVAEIALPLTDGPAAAVLQRAVPASAALTPDRFAAQVRAAVRPDYVRRQLK